MTHADTIDRLGGAASVADLLSAAHSDGPFDKDKRRRLRDSIYKWKEEDSIPWKWRPWMCRLLRDEGLEIPESLQDPSEAA